MKSLVFDAGPVISLTMNNLLWLLGPLRERFGGDFLISEAVRAELVDRPLGIKRFEFEALQVQEEIDCGALKVVSGRDVDNLTDELLALSNSIFAAKENNVSVVHRGEMSTLAIALLNQSAASVIDERTTRELVEKPQHIAKHMQSHLHTKVSIDYSALAKLRQKIGGLKVIRSVELAAVAYEMGLLDKYIDRCRKPSPELREQLLDSVLWGVKLDGCAVSEKEIRQLKRAVRR